MARIRSIKPEFPQSESMGNVSREARLLFILLWTLADDSGRCRGASKALASLLYPYDDDAADHIDEWLEQLEIQDCIVRYKSGGSTYLQINNWTNHQKIDKPSASKFPDPSGVTESRRSEREIELMLFEKIRSDQSIFGYRVIDVQRQVRVGSSYLDIVATTQDRSFVLELKRDRLSAGDVRQVARYAEISGATPVLVGAGLSPLFPISECKEQGIAVVTFDEDGSTSLIVDSEHVKTCSITFSNAIERQALDLRIKDQGVDAPQAAGDQSPSAPANPENQQCNSADEEHSPSRKRGTRLPEDWVLPKAWGEWALANRPGWGPDDVRLCADKFADYWRPKSGKDATKLDWLGTWRNWVRNDRTAPAGGSARPASSSSIFAGMI